MTNIELKRKTGQGESQMIPRPIPRASNLLQVDPTWGKVQPMQLADGVETVGELEVIDHIQSGLPLIDGRTRDFYEQGTIPDAHNIPYTEIQDRMNELDRKHPTVFFCNGPQCTQSPQAILTLLRHDYPAEKIRYYRGGMHDWLTLGFPVETNTK